MKPTDAFWAIETVQRETRRIEERYELPEELLNDDEPLQIRDGS